MELILIFYISLCFPNIVYSLDVQYIRNNNNNNSVVITGSKFQNCSIKAIDPGIRKDMASMLENGKKIIFIHLSFKNELKAFSEEYIGDIYKPMEWVRTVGRHGKSLLFLRPQFEELSLSTLSFETGHINVVLTQSPNKCLNSFNTTFIETKLQNLLLSDFRTGDIDGRLNEHEYICNMHIKNDNSRAVFYYQCCHKDLDGSVICQYLAYDYWINMLFTCISVINILALMLSPYLIPTSFYRKKYGHNVYEHKLVKPLNIRMMRTALKPPVDNGSIVPLGNLKYMPKFYKWIKNQPLNEILTLSLNKIDIAVSYQRLISSNYVPIGIMQTFYAMFIKCHIRKNPSFGRCCRGSVLGTSFFRKLQKREINVSAIDEKGQQPQINAKYPWHRCLRQLMRLLMLLTVAVPWVARSYFFYRYEKHHLDDKRHAASIRNLKLPFQWNLTNTLSPIHVVFLFCYFMFCLDAVVLGVASHKIKTKLQYLMRKCLRDMRDISRSKALEWSVLILLVPFEVFGVFGLFLTGFYLVFALPVICVVLAFYCLPTVNLSLRLIAHVVAYSMPYRRIWCCRSTCITGKRFLQSMHKHFHMDILSHSESLERPQRISVKNRFIQLFILLACLFTVFSFVFLAMETMIFFIEIFIYCIIGIITNASAMLKYISLVLMLGLYARDCFKGVSEKYLEYNKSMNRLIVDMAREKVEVIASSDEQKNTAFQIGTDSLEAIEKDTDNVKLIVKEGIPKWNVRRLILFLDEKDKPYLTDKFFTTTCYMDTVGVPGPLIYNIVRATWRFLCICLFLLFVVLIVLAFGDNYKISGTNQMLATLAGGFLPWVFRNILFKSKDALSLDTKNLSFKSNLKRKIEEYEQNWNINDISITENNNEHQQGLTHHQYIVSEREEIPRVDDKSAETIPMLSDTSDDQVDKFIDLIVYDNQARVTIV